MAAIWLLGVKDTAHMPYWVKKASVRNMNSVYQKNLPASAPWMGSDQECGKLMVHVACGGPAEAAGAVQEQQSYMKTDELMSRG